VGEAEEFGDLGAEGENTKIYFTEIEWWIVE
jgi:hypothetical protein